ncbi:DUF4893 domain-containing protein [Palleronia pelagia]|uniref:DUF4893 domain-containing protein n=1 Tax=Palleronia pelagia TaxID=387096 RepID=A0A1H8GY97_9RHOB|nr:DUF4893 domain-containing protein [Palleronia pelagia]SEN48477.1 protein of unknown function [Palleronia pelagia]
MLRASLLALSLLAVAPAWAAPQIRAADADRLARFEEAAGRALLVALSEGDAADIDVLTRALSGRPLAPAPNGDWNCRTIKLGGLSGLVAYTDFRCRITQVGPTEWRFEKLTGSQRTVGTISMIEGRLIYLGAGHTGEAPATDYAGLPDTQTAVEPNQTIPQVAVFEQTSGTSARLMFPYPLLESEFDLLYLTR